MGGSNSVMNRAQQSAQADKYQVQQPNTTISPQSTSTTTRKPLASFSKHVDDEEDNADEVLYNSSEYFDKELPVWFYSSNYGSSGRRGSLKKTRSLVMQNNMSPEGSSQKGTPPRSTSFQKLHKQDSPPESPTYSNSSPQLQFSTPPRSRPSLLTSVLKYSSPQTTPPPPKGNQVSPSNCTYINTEFSFQPVPSPSQPIRRVEDSRSRSQSAPTNSIYNFEMHLSNSMSESENSGSDSLQILVTPPASPPEHLTSSLTIRSIDSELRIAKREKREKKKRMLEIKKKQEQSQSNIANLPPLFQKIQQHTSNSGRSLRTTEEHKQIIRVK